MLTTPLEQLLERPHFTLAHAASVLFAASEPAATAEAENTLRARLPSGIEHASEIQLCDARPSAPPLSPDSRWHAEGSALQLVLPKRRAHAAALVSDLAALANLQPSIGSLEVRVPDALRPTRIVERAQAAVQPLLDGASEENVHVLATDDAIVFDLLSPYVRDLGCALSEWSDENDIAVPDAIDADDRGSFIASRLLARHPELLKERREAEASVGLTLTTSSLGTLGACALERLPSLDARLPVAPAEYLVLLQSEDDLVLGAWSNALRSRAKTTTLVYGYPELEPAISAPIRVDTECHSEAFDARVLVERSALINLLVDCSEVRAIRETTALPIRWIEMTRRAEGAIPDRTLVLYRTRKLDTLSPKWALDAGRAALTAVFSRHP